MYNDEFVTRALTEAKLYPPDAVAGKGIGLRLENGALHLSGNPWDLIELADLLVSLALSGENRGQHWHIDEGTLLDPNSDIHELVLLRNEDIL